MKINKKIKIMAVVISLILSTTTLFAQEKTKVDVKTKKAKKEKHTYSANIKTGFGYDDNPFLTPSNPYEDYTRTAINNNATSITPVKKSGVFIPLNFKANYEYRKSKDIRFISKLNYSEKYFTNKALKNANEYDVEASTGVRFRLNKYKREINRIDFNLIAGKVHEIYVDRDDGALKTSPSKDISNRYQYTKQGAELKYMYDFRKIKFMAKLSRENKDYATPLAWSELDHKYTRMKVKGSYKYSKKFNAGAYYEYRYADYKFRNAYDVDGTGQISLGNTLLNLTYNDIKLFTSYKLNRTYKVKFNYLISSRTDNNVGYSDLLTHSVSLDNKFKIKKGLYTSLKIKYSLYDYKNAYAYDNDTSLPKKEASAYQVNLDTKYKISSDLFAGLDLKFKNASSTDKRYEYDNIVAVANIKYKF